MKSWLAIIFILWHLDIMGQDLKAEGIFGVWKINEFSVEDRSLDYLYIKFTEDSFLLYFDTSEHADYVGKWEIKSKEDDLLLFFSEGVYEE